jgi:hypothetical protein
MGTNGIPDKKQDAAAPRASRACFRPADAADRSNLCERFDALMRRPRPQPAPSSIPRAERPPSGYTADEMARMLADWERKLYAQPVAPPRIRGTNEGRTITIFDEADLIERPRDPGKSTFAADLGKLNTIAAMREIGRLAEWQRVHDEMRRIEQDMRAIAEAAAERPTLESITQAVNRDFARRHPLPRTNPMMELIEKDQRPPTKSHPFPARALQQDKPDIGLRTPWQ